jgi:hypothetical protein
VPRSPRQPAELLSAEPFLGWWAVDEGLLTPDQLRSSAWRRVFRGVYVHRDVPVTHEMRARAACVLLPFAVVSGRSAAVCWGVDLAGPLDDVEVTVPARSHPSRIRGLCVRRAPLPSEERSYRRGIPVTSPESTAVRLAGLLPGDAAVIAVDQLVDTGYADLRRIRALAGEARGRGAARARTACALADGLAQSPQETRVRLLLHRSDGQWHAEPGQFAKDRARLNRLTAAGWRVIFVTAEDMRDPVRLLARIAAALAC